MEKKTESLAFLAAELAFLEVSSRHQLEQEVSRKDVVRKSVLTKKQKNARRQHRKKNK